MLQFLPQAGVGVGVGLGFVLFLRFVRTFRVFFFWDDDDDDGLEDFISGVSLSFSFEITKQ